MNISLYNDDYVNILPIIQPKSISMVLIDPPYNKTKARWDKKIDVDLMWELLLPLIDDKTAILVFGNEPFSSLVRVSNLNMYRYDWKWVKKRVTGFANCNYRPMNNYEDIMVFSTNNASSGGKANPMNYFPVGLKSVNTVCRNRTNRIGKLDNDSTHIGVNNSLKSTDIYLQKYTNYPKNTLFFENDPNIYHPTQKPIRLLEYLILTYSKEQDTVLDFFMGSGSTGVASSNLKRNFVGIEKDKKYFEIARTRIHQSN